MPATINGLLEYGASSRKLRAYAYLTAAFETKPRYGEGVSDALDCLVPFVVAGIAKQAGNQLDIGNLVAHLKTLGLNVPIYVIQQLLPRLQRIGAVDWNKDYKVHIAKHPPESVAEQLSQPVELAPIFDSLEMRIADYASEVAGILKPTSSASWADALIAFLKSETAGEVAKKAVNIKGAIIGEPDKIDAYIVAKFIKGASDSSPEVFHQIVQIFTGVLIEDFINTIQTLGDPATYRGLNIFYDTTVLLRLLGTSGKLFYTATLEMHRALQDLGCSTHYFEHNENEVINILSALLAAHDGGHELFGETAEAILDGEVSIAQIRDLTATYADRLGRISVFKSPMNYSNTRHLDQYQIDESRFVTALESEAMEQDRQYSRQNAEHDAMSLALITRVRQGKMSRDVSQSICIFISRNQLLQRVARRFLIKHAGYDWSHVAAILSIGQISTVAWLAAAKVLEPSRVTKELLANCYGALRPDKNWAGTFLQALNKFKQSNPEEVEAYADSVIFLKTARAVAQDESLGQTAILKQLNTIEIFQRAAIRAEEEQQRRDAEAAARVTEVERRSADQLAELAAVAEKHANERATILAAAAEARINREASAREQGQLDAANHHRMVLQSRCDNIAGALILAARYFLALLLFGAVVIDLVGYRNLQAGGALAWVVTGCLVVLNLISILQAMAVPVVAEPIERVRKRLAAAIYRHFVRD